MISLGGGMEYRASRTEKDLDIINLPLLEEEVAKIIPKGAFHYIRSGAGESCRVS